MRTVWLQVRSDYKSKGGDEFKAERVFTIPRPNGRILGVHGFGTEQPEYLVSMDLELSVFPSTYHSVGRALMSMIPHAR